MPAPPRTARRLPVVAILCALIFCLYGTSPGKALSVHCQAPQDPTALLSHCQVERGRRLGWLPAQQTELDWSAFTLTSRLCDNNPQGGVRFCHRLTLVGTERQITLPDQRTPLTAEVVAQGMTRFLASQSPSTLAWSTPYPRLETLHTLALALLLTLTAWGLGAWPWPVSRPPELADDDPQQPD